MYLHRRIHIIFNLTSHVAIFLLIGLTHEIEVHTDAEVNAEYGGQTTLSCWYTPTSSTSSFSRILWSRGSTPLIYINGDDNPSKTEGRYSLLVDRTRSGNLTINDVHLGDEESYTCEVGVTGYLAEKSSVNLRVEAAPEELVLRSGTASTPVSIHQGAVTLRPGLETTFVCEAVRSRPPATIEWYMDDDLRETDEETPTPNSQDAGLQNTTSSFVIAEPGLMYQGKSLTCRAVWKGKMVLHTSIVINVEKPPDRPIAVLGLADHITSSKQTPSCIASNSFPSSQITWSLGGTNVTDNAEVRTVMASGMMTVTSELDYSPTREDYGKILQCRVSHVTLEEDIIAEKAICLNDTKMTVSVKQVLSTSLLLKLSGISHPASCTLEACEASRGSTVNSLPGDGCFRQSLGDIDSDTIENYEFRVPVSSTYKIVLRCHHSSCGESTATAEAAAVASSILSNSNTEPEQQNSSESVPIRDLIFVIIAVMVVSAFVIVVTVSIVLRAVVKGSIRAANKAQGKNPVTTSPHRVRTSSRSSVLSSMNLYTIEEGNEGESKIYQEIKESRSSLVEPSDILVSTLPSSQQRHTPRLSMRHPRPPPLPPPVHRSSFDPAILTMSDSTDTETEKDDYVPMSPDTYSIDSEYMAMNSASQN